MEYLIIGVLAFALGITVTLAITHHKKVKDIENTDEHYDNP